MSIYPQDLVQKSPSRSQVAHFWKLDHSALLWATSCCCCPHSVAVMSFMGRQLVPELTGLDDIKEEIEFTMKRLSATVSSGFEVTVGRLHPISWRNWLQKYTKQTAFSILHLAAASFILGVFSTSSQLPDDGFQNWNALFYCGGSRFRIYEHHSQIFFYMHNFHL